MAHLCSAVLESCKKDHIFYLKNIFRGIFRDAVHDFRDRGHLACDGQRGKLRED